MVRTNKLLYALTLLFVVMGFPKTLVPAAPGSSPARFETQAELPMPSPYPTPAVDLRPYLHEQGGTVVTVGKSDDLGIAINEAENKLGANPGKIVVRGGGTIKTQVVVSHDLSFQPGVYTCDTITPWQGCILLKDNVKAEAMGDVTILEPTYNKPGAPAITVFQNYAGAKKNENASHHITVKGFRIKGRQRLTDGGMRQSISFGNCSTCAAIGNTLDGIASIGISFGGSAAEGNHAKSCVATDNTIIAAAAAGIAVVNAADVWVYDNTILRPGRAGGPGGVSGVDVETNHPDDWCENIKIYNNRMDYQGSAFGRGAGSAILVQNVYKTDRSGGLLIANNYITGGSPTVKNTSLSNGIAFTQAFKGALVVNNKIQNAKQHGLLLYGSRDATFQDLEIESCGGGGNAAVELVGGGNNRFIRLNVHTPPGVAVSTLPEIRETKGSKDNVFKDNSVPVQRR
jgi:hypothetical protein